MLNPAEFGLKENPFSILPNAEVKHWAGLNETKKALADVVSSVRPDDVGASEFVVLHGDYGAGKSHALRYYTHSINKDGNNRAIYLSEIMVGAGLSFSALYPGILDQLKDEAMNRLVNQVNNSVNNCARQLHQKSGFNVTPDLAIEQKVPQQDREMVKALMNSSGQVPPMGTDDYSTTRALASLFRVMTSSIGDDPPAFGAVYLFLDEMEYAFDDKAAKQIAFFSALRSLINGVTEHFALILSFTAHAALLEAAVPAYLQERMTRPYLQCEQLTADEAKKFVKDYLGFVRLEGSFSPPQPFYPFSEAAINTIFDRETTLVPRKILKHLRRVWERAARSGSLQSGDEISQEMADGILDGVV